MYNTVLGAKPLQEDGRAFYYSDYNYSAERVYHAARWPCCSGTLPQVAADYRINTYFRSPRAIYVNLYLPSTLRWTEDGVVFSLTQEGQYPFDGPVTFTFTLSQPAERTVWFRIPEWAEGASLSVNGIRQKGIAVPGRFTPLHREWRTGDRVELELPLKMRLEPIDRRHANTVALLRGPLVLMAVKQAQDTPAPQLTRAQLLSARRLSERQWQAKAEGGPVTLLPFPSIGDRPYTTYLHVS